MKKLILFLLLLSAAAYGQTNNTTNTKFTNGLAAPNGATQKPTSGLTAGALSYVTGAGLYVYNGSAWELLGLSSGGVTSFNSRTGVVVPLIGDYSAFYTPLTRSLTINGATQTLAADRTWTITANTPNSLSTGYGLLGSSFEGSVARTWVADTASSTGLVSKLRLLTNLTGYVQKPTTITINGVTQDLSANRTYNVGTVLSVGATAGTGINIAGTSPITSSGTYTITNTLPDQTVVLNNGTGISNTGTYPNFTVTNTLPDQTVVLNAGTGISTSGTYPNFTITNTSPSSGGTVTSVATGYGLSGGTITSSGTLVADTTSSGGLVSKTRLNATNFAQNRITGLPDSLLNKANRNLDNVYNVSLPSGTVADSLVVIGGDGKLYKVSPASVSTQGIVTYIFARDASDISGYEQLPALSAYTVGLADTATATVSTAETLIQEFATNTGFPNISVIPAGLFNVHYETQKASGSNNYYSYAKIYKRDLAGTETLLLTTDNSSQTALNSVQQITVTGLLAANETLLTTDRVVVKVYARMISSTASISVYYDDNTDARLEFPSTLVNASNFVPYVGATKDLVSTYNITADSLKRTGGLSTEFLKGDGSVATSIGQSVITGLADSLLNKANKTFDNVANAAIPIAKLASSTISGVNLGGNLANLSAGTGLSFTAYNGGTARTANADTTVLQTVANFFPKGDTRYLRGTGVGVSSITGTANQVVASASTGAVTLSLPQSIATSSSPQFTGLTLTNDININGLSNRSIGWGGNSSAGAANPLIYSDKNYLAINSKAGSILYLNPDNTNSASTVDIFLGKASFDYNGKLTLPSIKITSGASNGYILKSDASGNASWQSPTSTYKGTWDASTNTPTLADGVGTAGDEYYVSVSGTQFGRSFVAGGKAVYNGSIWQPIGVSASVTSVNGYTGAVVLAKSDIGLSNVDNTSDLNKPISTATQTALDLKSNLVSPTFTGTPLAPTATAGTNTTQLATTAFVQAGLGSYLPLTGGVLSGNLKGTSFQLTDASANNYYFQTASDYAEWYDGLGRIRLQGGNTVISGGDAIIDNGKFYKAKRNTGGVAINVLGFASGSDDLIQTTSDTYRLRNTGATDLVTVTNAGTMAITGNVTAANLSGTNSGDQTTITGNSGTATALQTARNIQGVAFNGSADINPINGTGFVKATGTTLSYDNTTYYPNSNPSGFTSNTGTVTSVATGYGLSGGTITSTGTLLADTTSAGALVSKSRLVTNLGGYAKLASPTFTGTVGGITAAMVGAPSGSGSSTGTNTGDQTTITGNAGTATALQTARTIGTLTGDVTTAGSSFDGTANNTNATTLATVNANVGSFGSSTSIPTFTVNGKGLITAASGNAVIAPAGTLTGATLASGVTASSLTSAAGGAFGTNAYTSTAYAPLASPTFTGTPSLPTGTTGVTQTAGDNSTKLATTAYVDATSASGSGASKQSAVIFTDVNSSSSGAIDLAQHTISTATNGDKISFEYAGNFAANANTKPQMVLTVDGTDFTIPSITPGNNEDWIISGSIIRVSSTLYKININYFQSGQSNYPQVISGVTLDTGSLVITLTAPTTVANNDIVLASASIQKFNAP